MLNWNMRWRWRIIGLLLITILSALPIAAYGEGGDGSGNASGVFKPLGLVSATLEDGTSIIDAENIPLKPKITMHFDKNVVSLVYWERNKRCFHLYDKNGQELALNLSKIDDTVNFSKRQYIWVEPADALASGTNYKLYVAPDLLAKNGGSTLAMTTNNQGVTINFKTAGEKTADTSKPTGSTAGDQATAATNGASIAPAPSLAADKSAVTTDSPNKFHTGATVNQNGEKTADTGASTKTSAAAPAAAVTSGKNDQPVVAGSTKDKAVTGDSPAGSNAETIAKQSNEVSPGGSAAPSQEAAAEFAAMQQGRRVQYYAAVAAGIILVGWVAAEFFRRRKMG